jgi:hypothetical protein
MLMHIFNSKIMSALGVEKSWWEMREFPHKVPPHQNDVLKKKREVTLWIISFLDRKQQSGTFGAAIVSWWKLKVC